MKIEFLKDWQGCRRGTVIDTSEQVLRIPAEELIRGDVAKETNKDVTVLRNDLETRKVELLKNWTPRLCDELRDLGLCVEVED